MEFEMPKIKVYIKVDSNDNIIAVNSSVFLSDVTDWIEIDEGDGDKYAHAQANYLDGGICTETGIYKYKYVNEEVYQKNEQDMAEEISAIPPAPISESEKLKQRQDATEAAIDGLLMLLMGGML